MKKGPQTIEKAKQGAYVARTVSSLQNIRFRDGSLKGVVQDSAGGLICRPYFEFLQEIVASQDPNMLRDFTLTVGVVSNHGNWFTSDDHNKELKVLAQSYDWLVFLTDSGLAAFTEELLLAPSSEYQPVRDAFLASYDGTQGKNKFTKVEIALAADLALHSFFTARLDEVKGWFNVIAPGGRRLAELEDELLQLAAKPWGEILR